MSLLIIMEWNSRLKVEVVNLTKFSASIKFRKISLNFVEVKGGFGGRGPIFMVV